MEERKNLPTRWLLALGLFLILALISSPLLTIPRPKLKIGDIAPRDIKAPQELSVIHKGITLKRQEEEASKVRPVYDFNTRLIEELKSKVSLIFEGVKRVRGEELSLEEKSALLDEELAIKLSEKTRITLLSYSKPDRLKNQIIALLQTIIQEKIVDNSELFATKIKGGIEVRTSEGKEILLLKKEGIYTPSEAKRLLEARCQELFPDNRFLRNAGYEVAGKLLIPNFRYDDKATREKQRKARESIPPVISLFKKGQIIVEEGKLITEDQLLALETLWQTTTKRTFPIIIGRALIILVLMAGIGFYLRRYQAGVLKNNVLLSVLGLIVILMLLLTKALTFTDLSGYFIPVAFATILIAVILGGRLAIMTGVALAILVGLLTGNRLPFVIVALAGGTTGAYAVRWLKHRTDFLRAGALIALTNCLLILAFILLGIEPELKSLWWGLGNGFASSLLAFALLPVFEHGFKVTTDIRLLELSNLNQPILKRLAIQAPGTYHHSIIVGNLAEGAAEAAGANPLLARVASYYHDIGKIKNSDYFIENRIGTSSEYKKLVPRLSSQIIISHVKEGVEIARDHRLTPRIINIIAQHHGTSLISQFYRKALKIEEEGVEEEDYRYPGPRPRSKEAAIVMLADSVEAASRAFTKPSPEEIGDLVREIINEKFTDSQLDESPLTLSDLKKIVEIFSHTLSGITHGRIDYPLTKRIKRRYGNTGKEHNKRKRLQALFGKKGGEKST
ncbi:HDIG domain-containing protein [bacterium]|nr:HDIG domain-containing protein [bacterium]MCG2677028.1 HDIG domain-containing protein [bacterium]